MQNVDKERFNLFSGLIFLFSQSFLCICSFLFYLIFNFFSTNRCLKYHEATFSLGYLSLVWIYQILSLISFSSIRRLSLSLCLSFFFLSVPNSFLSLFSSLFPAFVFFFLFLSFFHFFLYSHLIISSFHVLADISSFTLIFFFISHIFNYLPLVYFYLCFLFLIFLIFLVFV